MPRAIHVPIVSVISIAIFGKKILNIKNNVIGTKTIVIALKMCHAKNTQAPEIPAEAKKQILLIVNKHQRPIMAPFL